MEYTTAVISRSLRLCERNVVQRGNHMIKWCVLVHHVAHTLLHREDVPSWNLPAGRHGVM